MMGLMAIALRGVNHPNCTYDSGRGSTFNLEYLSQSPSTLHPDEIMGFAVKDEVKVNRTYIFNVCANTSVVPGSFNDSPCEVFLNRGESVAAWQTERFYRSEDLFDHSWVVRSYLKAAHYKLAV